MKADRVSKLIANWINCGGYCVYFAAGYVFAEYGVLWALAVVGVELTVVYALYGLVRMAQDGLKP